MFEQSHRDINPNLSLSVDDSEVVNQLLCISEGLKVRICEQYREQETD